VDDPSSVECRDRIIDLASRLECDSSDARTPLRSLARHVVGLHDLKIHVAEANASAREALILIRPGLRQLQRLSEKGERAPGVGQGDVEMVDLLKSCADYSITYQQFVTPPSRSAQRSCG
jgi:hypothetical protein